MNSLGSLKPSTSERHVLPAFRSITLRPWVNPIDGTKVRDGYEKRDAGMVTDKMRCNAVSHSRDVGMKPCRPYLISFGHSGLRCNARALCRDRKMYPPSCLGNGVVFSLQRIDYKRARVSCHSFKSNIPRLWVVSDSHLPFVFCRHSLRLHTLLRLTTHHGTFLFPLRRACARLHARRLWSTVMQAQGAWTPETLYDFVFIVHFSSHLSGEYPERKWCLRLNV